MINAAHLLTAADPLGGQGRGVAWTGAATAATFAAAVKLGRLNLPLPGSGRTRERWRLLRTWPGKISPWPGSPRDTPMRWPSWLSSAPPSRRPQAAGVYGPLSLPAQDWRPARPAAAGAWTALSSTAPAPAPAPMRW